MPWLNRLRFVSAVLFTLTLGMAVAWAQPIPLPPPPEEDKQSPEPAGDFIPGDALKVPHNLKERFTPFLNESLWVRTGGYVQMNLMGEWGAPGKPITLMPSQLGFSGASTTVTDYVPLGEDARLSLRRTRLFVDAYSNFSDLLEGTRGYAEVDFSGPNGAINVRHLYVALPYVTLGRTYSAFKDPAAEPEAIDPAGPNAQMGQLQQGIRLVLPIGEDVFSLGLEDPGGNPSVTGFEVSADNLVRKVDIAAHYQLNREWGHLQLSGVQRNLGTLNPIGSPGQPTQFKGWGIGVSGQIFTEGKDNLLFEVSGGEGIGRYIADLAGTQSELGVSASGQVGVQFAAGGYVGYQHWLDDCTRLNTYASMTHVQLRAGQPTSSFQSGYKVSANVIRDLTKSLRVGMEFEHAIQVTGDGASIHGELLEFMVRYSF